MHWGSVLFLAVGLAMDAAAVSAARGLATPTLRLGHAVRVAVFFGGFQALLPFLGWLLGRWLGPTVEAWDHWIVFALLTGIGAKMLWESRAHHKGQVGRGHVGEAPVGEALVDEARGGASPELFAPRVMFLLALATSIDAFAAGITLPLLGAPIALSLAIIGLTTALLSVLALVAGRRFGAILGKRMEAVGGVVLVGLGLKFLLEHLLGR